MFKMKKRIIATIIIFALTVPIFALELQKNDRLSYYLKASLSPSFTSEKIFSSSPSRSGRTNWAMGLDLSCDIYRNDESANWGSSSSLYVGYPFLSKEIVNGEKSEIDNNSLTLFFSTGLVFRATPSTYLDASLALRFALFSYDYFDSGLIVGLTLESNADYFLYDELYLSFGLNLTNGIMKLTFSDSERWYEDHYSTVLLRAKLGVGYKIGDRRR